MASVLNLELLQSFDIIFPVLLVFALVFAVLQKTKAITDNGVINTTIAIAISFLVLLSETAVEIINFSIPWFVIAIVFFILLLLIFQVFGIKEGEILKAVQNERGIIWVIIGVVLIILVAAFGHVLGQSAGPYLSNETIITAAEDGTVSVATGDFSTNVSATLFHPKVLGIIVLFGIMIFAILLLTGKNS